VSNYKKKEKTGEQIIEEKSLSPKKGKRTKWGQLVKGTADQISRIRAWTKKEV